MYRRFVNVVSHDLRSRIYSLHRVDVWKHLFYQSTGEARAAAWNNRELGLFQKIKSSWLLPRPEIVFRGAQTDENRSFDCWFSLLGGGDGRILFADSGCKTALYNANLKGISPMPNAHCQSWFNPVCISIPRDDRTGSQSLYVMDQSRDDTCFEVLARTQNDLCPSIKNWCWHTLPRLPFRFDPALEETAGMCPHSVVDSRTIYVSSSLENSGSTYMYDTVNSVWTKAGDWVLPFFGKAEYVPELNLWFGLATCKTSYRLCAFDLSAMNLVRPPMPQHTWDVFDLSDEQPPSHVHLVNLGAGRFCIATFFEPIYDDEEEDILEDEFVVLTGVEVQRKVDDEDTLLMTEHMSRSTENIQFVL